MKTVIIIPSRYGSTRLPGKPLKDLAGKSLVQRVWQVAKAVQGVDGVFVATDDSRIEEHVKNFGGDVIMTGECENGTERAWAAIQNLDEKPEYIINLQGDAPLTPPWVIEEVVKALHENSEVQIATPCVRFTNEQYDRFKANKNAGQVGGTTVTRAKNGDALYFSKGIIPFLRERIEPLPVFQHIGLYGYRYDALEAYLKLPPSPLEQVEKLEQLRALENNMPIRVVEVDYRGRSHWGVDSQEDADRVIQIIKSEGELVACS